MPKHLDTPKKSKILGGKEFLEYLKEKVADKDGNINLRKLRGGGEALADYFDTGSRTVSTVLSKGRERRTFEKEEERRGGFRSDEVLRLGSEQLDEAERVIEENGYEGHDISAGALRYEAQLPRVSERTLRSKLRKRGFGRYVVLTKDGVLENDARERVEKAKELLSRFPTTAD